MAPLEAAAVELFLERARAARPGFEPDAEAVALAAEIVRRVDGLPLAIELAAARVNVLGLGELVSILERRAALLRDSPASDPARTALQGLVEWSYDLLHGDEKTLLQQLAVHRGGASLPSLVALAARHGLNEATVAYLVAALVDKSIVSASFTGGAARYDMLDTVREYVLERLAESGGLAAARGAHAEYFAALADEARVELRGPEWLRWERRLELENDNLWAALAYARDAPDPAVAVRLGTLGWYFALADRVSEGRRFLELALSATDDDAPVELRIEQLADLCYIATEEFDLGPALVAGERAVSLAATAAAPWQRGFAQLMLALALGQSGDVERAATMADDATAAFEAARDDWGIAASSLIRAIGAAHAGDVSAVTATASVARRHSDAVGYDAFRAPALLLEAWAAEGRGEDAAAVDAYRRAFELAGRIGFGDHAAFALAGLGAIALANGDLRKAEELQRQALATAEAAQAPLVAAQARVHLARIAAASANTDEADRLYREVLEWSTIATAAPGARESLRRARRQPGHCSRARARRDRRAPPRHRAHLELAEAPPRLAARWHRRRRAFLASENRPTGGSNMSTTTIEDQLADVRRRIARLQALAQTGPVAEIARIQRHLDALHQEEASVLAAVRGAPDEVEEKLGQLRTRLAVAENSLVADVSDEWTTFAAAVEDELRSWDTYLERLQATAVAKAGNARERAEAAIADVRTQRIAVYDRLAQAREDVNGAWHEQRNHVSSARDELEQKADELSARIN